MCQLRPPASSQNRVCRAAQARRRSLSLGGSAAFELASLARGAAMAVIGSCLVERCRTGERPLSLGARSWCDVLAAASNFKTAPRGSCGAGASVLAISGMETQHSSLLRVRVMSRWLWSVRTLPKDAATARLFSPSAHGRGVAYQLQPPASCQRRVARAALARRHSLCLGWRRSTRPCCARAVLRWSQTPHSPLKDAAPARGLSPSVRSRGTTCQLRPPAPSQRRVTQRSRASARCLLGEEG
jgi:hypothetical protein